MRIKSLQLKNFKRFTDLTLQDIPENAKLVLLIGSNGSGKSSVFDAFEAANSKTFFENNKQYYRKNKENSWVLNIEFHKDSYIKISEGGVDYHSIMDKTFFGRSAVRYLSNLTKTNFRLRH